MNVFSRFAGIFLASLVLSGCDYLTLAGNEANNKEDEFSGTTYTAVLDADYLPYGLRDENGQAAGFDVDILKAIAEDQGFAVKFTPTSWDLLLNSLATAEYQIVMGGIAKSDITEPEHRVNYVFSSSYAYGRDGIATIPITMNIRTFGDLAQRRVATLADSAYTTDLESLQANVGSKGTILAEDTTFLAFQNLFQGEADAVLMDVGVLSYYKKTTPDVTFNIHQEGGYFTTPYEMVYLIRRDTPELEQKIEAGIKNIVENGTYQIIYDKWFGTEPEHLPNTLFGVKAISKP